MYKCRSSNVFGSILVLITLHSTLHAESHGFKTVAETTTIEPDTQKITLEPPSSETETTTTLPDAFKKDALHSRILISENAIIPSDSHGKNVRGISANNGDELDLETWVAPAFIRQNYPYYLSGYDDDNRPIWIAEVGKFDIRRLVEAGGEVLKTFDKYVEQALHRSILAFRKRPSEWGDSVNETAMIYDFDQFNMLQIAHTPTVQYLLGLVRKHKDLIDKHLHIALAVNVNYVANAFLNLVKPVAGNVMDRVEVYGTNKAKWIPHILRHFPRDQLPEWYGGASGYKSVQIYG